VGLFRLEERPIQSEREKELLADPRAGALVTFEGWVRNRNEGREVTSLVYQAYGLLAEKEGGRVIEEARRRYALLAARCVHRVGHLAVGELAVWVGVTAGHRDEAFAACRFIIDQVKARVPIWKLEHYAHGRSEWVGCAALQTGAPGAPEAGQRQERIPPRVSTSESRDPPRRPRR